MPPLGRGALYIRPLLLGSGPLLGLGPAPSYTFVVYAAAVGAYFKVRDLLMLVVDFQGSRSKRPAAPTDSSTPAAVGTPGDRLSVTVPGACTEQSSSLDSGCCSTSPAAASTAASCTSCTR